VKHTASAVLLHLGFHFPQSPLPSIVSSSLFDVYHWGSTAYHRWRRQCGESAVPSGTT